jgi:hypothetical protein
MLKRINFILNIFGFYPIKLIYFFKGIVSFCYDYHSLNKQVKKVRDFKFGKFYPVLDDKFNTSGTMKGHYFHQDLYVASKIYKNSPLKHIDIGSRIDGFVAHVAVFREIEIFDIRPQESTIKNIVFKQADLMKMQDQMKEYCDSISSLHAIEHFGLGRYGDPIDVFGHIRAIDNIHMILKTGGKFFFSVPIGKQRIEFNAHRVFSLKYLLNILNSKFIIEAFSYVDDMGAFFENVELSKESIEVNFNCVYGCGIFELTKI